jgi:hypothetical protein
LQVMLRLRTIRLIDRTSLHNEAAQWSNWIVQTKLRHVDIHNHWLRQEIFQKRIRVVHTKSKDMIADGLTKVLTNEDFVRFRDHMGLVNIGERIKERRL